MIIPLHKYQVLVDSCRGADVVDRLMDAFSDMWLDDYHSSFPISQVYTVTLDAHGSSQTYLFDVDRGRVVAAFGVPVYVATKRDAGRQKGHPNGAGSRYVKGHLIAHSLGGDMDINVIPQLKKVNGGEFRKLEKIAQSLTESGVRALYFVHCSYGDGDTQKPNSIEQAIVEPPRSVYYSVQSNL